MALVSPGVSVTITDESFYIPASASTIPLMFVATSANKYQPDGVSIADGTNESGIVRTVTSIGESVQLYGVPKFRYDNAGTNGSVRQYHGDCRNEYGLFALNQFLSIGNKAFVVRANIDTSDETQYYLAAAKLNDLDGNFQMSDIVDGTVFDSASLFSDALGDGTISNITIPDDFRQPESFNIVCIGIQQGDTVNSFTVTGSVSGTIGVAKAGTTFSHPAISFDITEGATLFAAGDYFQFTTKYEALAYPTNTGNGVLHSIIPGDIVNVSGSFNPKIYTVTFTTAEDFTVEIQEGTSGGYVLYSSTTDTMGASASYTYSDPMGWVEFTLTAGAGGFAAGDAFEFVINKVAVFNPLGLDDSQRREKIVTALQAEINSNQDVRSEVYEYNLILCPGYPEVADELLALSDTLSNEAFVIADVPVTKTPEQAANWASTSERRKHTDIAYYYPWGLASNLDGYNVLCAPSGIALKTYAYSDKATELWFAPAGLQRGIVTGVETCGYVTGTLGLATTYIEAPLNSGQRDNLYDFYKNINPITFLPNYGLTIFGQKTSSPAASARDRVNIERLLCYIRRQLRKSSYVFLFQPNDQQTRDDIKAMIDGFLNDLMMRRALYDFVTLCDSSNNTPVRIDRNELWVDIALKPVKAVEFIYIPIRILATGASFG
jgi:hypothetical protein